MKVRIFKILIIVLAIFFPLSVTLTSCSTKSAYEIAVENGFTGTEQEWLDSLKGKSAYEIAVENGFKGSEEEWLDSLVGDNGRDGEDTIRDSYDAYLKAKELGEIDDGMSYLDFLRDIFASKEEDISKILTKNLSSVVEVHCFLSPQKSVSGASGSGVIYKIEGSGEAYIVTNYHVVFNRSNLSLYPYYSVTMFDQTQDFDATIVGASMTYDIAVLKVETSRAFLSSNPTAVELGGDVRLGQTCYAIGNTKDMGIAITRGIVSSESEHISMTVGAEKGIYREFRHDAFIFHGNSGGGLFDSNGKLIGITNGGIENTLINYAIPISIVKAVTENIIENKNIVMGTASYITGIERHLEASEVVTIYDPSTGTILTKEKILLTGIDFDSPLYQDSGLMINDELVKLTYNGQEYSTSSYTLKSYTLSELLLSGKNGDEIELEFLREGTQTITVKVVLSRDFMTLLP